MGPTSFNVGDRCESHVLTPDDAASMGPTSFNVGDSVIDIDNDHQEIASMGPTSFNVGDLPAPSVSSVVHSLQWGRRLSTSETVGALPEGTSDELASMGPTSFNVGDKVSEAFTAHAVVRASMGPTSFNVGDMEV